MTLDVFGYSICPKCAKRDTFCRCPFGVPEPARIIPLDGKPLRELTADDALRARLARPRLLDYD